MNATERLMSAIDSDMPHDDRVAHAECVAQVVANALRNSRARRSVSETEATRPDEGEE